MIELCINQTEMRKGIKKVSDKYINFEENVDSFVSSPIKPNSENVFGRLPI